MNIKELKQELYSLKDFKKAESTKRFFKVGKGEYGEGQEYLGISVPMLREIAKKYLNLNLNELQELLDTHNQTIRFIALVILINKYNKSKNPDNKKTLFDFYLKNTHNINNWDLVDISCHKIVGDFLLNNDRNILYQLSKSNNLWEKRISIVSTYAFIRKNQFEDTLNISEILLEDSHDLMHKAVGWMLREVGKRDELILENFLQKNYNKIKRTTLRYAIEKFEETKRQKYLKGEF